MYASEDDAKAAQWNRLELLRDPSHVRCLPLSELKALLGKVGLEQPAESLYGIHDSVKNLLGRSFPNPGDDAKITAMFAASVTDDSLGIPAPSKPANSGTPIRPRSFRPYGTRRGRAPVRTPKGTPHRARHSLEATKLTSALCDAITRRQKAAMPIGVTIIRQRASKWSTARRPPLRSTERQFKPGAAAVCALRSTAIILCFVRPPDMSSLQLPELIVRRNHHCSFRSLMSPLGQPLHFCDVRVASLSQPFR